jgi:hypothetical protein
MVGFFLATEMVMIWLEDCQVGNRGVSGQVRRWLVVIGIILVLLSLLLLGYALLPGSETLRIQSTLSPTLLAAPWKQ